MGIFGKLDGSRALVKFFRDGAVVSVGALLLYITDNIANLGLPPQYYPLASAVSLGAYRLFRDAFGKGPTTPPTPE